jgi:RHS repeat-associated protein
LQFFPTAEGYVKNTNGIYSYVFNYTDHLGNVRLSYSDTSKNGLIETTEIVDESHYYPFGLKHSGYVTAVPDPNYKYKYQGQERQDELGLNWDSFKWRNYDYAIGRFMSIDPLAQQYEYNSPYAFQENKLGLGRELEGLELSSERSQDGKSITLTYRVNVVNNTGNASTGQVSQMVSERMCSTESSFSGQTKNGETVTTNVVYDPKATITWEYNDAIVVENGKAGEATGKGYTSPDGNTQVNKTQVNVPNNLEFDKKGNPIVSDKSNPAVTKTGNHEDGHVAGLKDTGGDKSNLMNNKDNSTKITPEQRTQIIKKVELEQPLKN